MRIEGEAKRQGRGAKLGRKTRRREERHEVGEKGVKLGRKPSHDEGRRARFRQRTGRLGK